MSSPGSCRTTCCSRTPKPSPNSARCSLHRKRRGLSASTSTASGPSRWTRATRRTSLLRSATSTRSWVSYGFLVSFSFRLRKKSFKERKRKKLTHCSSFSSSIFFSTSNTKIRHLRPAHLRRNHGQGRLPGLAQAPRPGAAHVHRRRKEKPARLGRLFPAQPLHEPVGAGLARGEARGRQGADAPGGGRFRDRDRPAGGELLAVFGAVGVRGVLRFEIFFSLSFQRGSRAEVFESKKKT